MEEPLQNIFRVENELPFLDPLISEWFNLKYSGLSDPQKKAIPLIHAGKSVLVSSPTGTGKTLSAFLAILNELFIQARNGLLKDSVFCLYISPLKALANDIDRNLKEPLNEIYKIAEEHGHDFPSIRVGVRSGDTPQNERQKMLRKPPHILITTPESFSLSLTAPKFREHLKSIKYVIIDEIHEISSNKRGTLLSANLERLEAITGNVVRIGLSATQAPLDLIATYLCGYNNGERRPFEIIESDIKKSLDLKVLTPVSDLTKVSYEVANEKMYDILTDLIRKHRTTLIFTNTRSGTEHVAIRLKARGIESIEAHHSSLGKETRFDVENRLKNGELQCVITSTSLELGIDIGFIDLVIQIGSPKSVSKGLQRIGRSGHGLDVLSKGRFVVFELDDLVECAVLTKAAYDREIDRVTVPENSLDVLSQVLVGMSLEKAWGIEEAYDLLKGSFAYHNLDHADYMNTLRYLAGQVEDQTIYSKIWLDETDQKFGKKKSSRMIFFMNVGTIPEEADYQVMNEAGKHLGQLSDKFVERLKPGDVFVLGAKIHMFLSTRRNRVIVKDATGMRPTVPSWTGEMLPRSYDLGVLVGKFREEVARRIDRGEEVEDWLEREYRLDRSGAISIASYIRSQKNFGIPTDRHLLVEGYIDDSNLFNTIYHVPLGRRVNDALSRSFALAITNEFSINVRISVTDDGFMLTFPQKVPIKDQINLVKKADFNDIVKRSIINTEVFKQRFRHCATRSLMVLRKYKGFDISVVRQQLRSDKVLRTLGSMENFPVIKETYHEIMNDMMDVPRAQRYVDTVIKGGHYSINDYAHEGSPFSYGLILAGISDIVLMEDRSKILKDLQGKILDRIYSGNTISFMFREAKVVENYFLSKVPKIASKEDLVRNIDHFLFVDPLRNRFNSPFPYASYDIKKDIEEIIHERKLVSVFAKAPQWTSINYYDIVRSAFIPADDLPHESRIIDLCTGKTFREIRSESKEAEQDLRNELSSLESHYLIRREIVDGNVIYFRNDLPFSKKDKIESIMEMIRLLLGSTGPLTVDEISIRIPVKQEDLENALARMLDERSVNFDFITPVFSKQYILQEDLNALKSGNTKDIQQLRVNWLTRSVQDIGEYFTEYGFSMDEWSYTSRCANFNRDELDSLIESGSVKTGRIIRHKETVAAGWLIDALHSLRYEKPDRNIASLVEAVASGVRTEQDLASTLNFDRQVIKQLVRSAEFGCLIGHDRDNLLFVIKGLSDPINKKDAIKMMIEKYGPVSLNELSSFFWFYTNDLEGMIDAERNYVDGDVKFGSIRDLKQKNAAVISDLDPVSVYLRKEFKNTDTDHHFFYNGRSVLSFNMEIREDTMMLSDGFVSDIDGAASFVPYLKDLVDRNIFTTVVYENAPKQVIELASSYGIPVTEKSFSIGEITLLDISPETLLYYAAYREEKSHSSPDSVYDNIKNSPFGFFNEVEASYSGISPVQLNSYIRSRILYTIRGAYGQSVYGTIETASLFRSLRDRKLTENETRVLRLVMEANGVSEREVIMGLRTNIFGIGSTLKTLFLRSIIAKDANRKYIFVPEKFEKREAFTLSIRKLIERFGFIDWERFSRFAVSDSDQEIFEDICRDMMKAGKIFKAKIHGGSKIVYATRDLMNFRKKLQGIRIITQKELISLYLQDLVKSAYGSGMILLTLTKNEIYTFKEKQKSGWMRKISQLSGGKIPSDVRRELMRHGFMLNE